MTARRRRLLLNGALAAGLVLTLVGAGLVLLRPATASGSGAAARTVRVSTGDVSATASADGTVQAADELAANFETSGTVTAVTVDVGDVVSEGEVLARLDTADAKRAVEVARLSLRSAEESLSVAQDGITSTEPDTTVVDQVLVARRKAVVTQRQTATQQAQSALQAAQESLSAAKRGTDVTDPTTGQTTTVVDEGAVARATSAVAEAKKAYNAAVKAQTSAEVALARAQAGRTVAGDSTTTVDDAAVASARARVIEAQATYDDARAALTACTLRAPGDGTVLEVNGKVGTTVTAGSSGGAGGSTTTGSESTTGSDLIVIADLDDLEVSVAFAESDISRISVGQVAALSFPGLDDATGTGKVRSVSPTATTSSSVVTYPATVRITASPDELRLGQSATVTITTASATDVTVVPSAAVTTSGGRSTVTLVTGDQQVVTPIEVGVAGADYTEVVSGVTSGDQVVLTSATADTSDSEGATFGPGGFGGAGQPPAMQGNGPGGQP